MNVAVLAGGTGGAKLARGFARALAPHELTIITNTADDDEFWTLRVSPDTDAVLYRLAGMYDETRGFGVRGDTFSTLRALRALGEDTWFQLGDADIALQLLRETLRRNGATLSDSADELRRRLAVGCAVVPMSDDPVRTRIVTDDGPLPLQEWFVRHRATPEVRGVSFDGADIAAPSARAAAALAAADLIVIGPSNPVISIAPLLRVLAPHIDRARTVAVTPVVAGRSLKGPTAVMLQAMGIEVSAVGVARHYANVTAAFVVDEQDRAAATDVEALGMRVLVLDTVMRDEAAETRLASAIMQDMASR